MSRLLVLFTSAYRYEKKSCRLWPLSSLNARNSATLVSIVSNDGILYLVSKKYILLNSSILSFANRLSSDLKKSAENQQAIRIATCISSLRSAFNFLMTRSLSVAFSSSLTLFKSQFQGNRPVSAKYKSASPKSLPAACCLSFFGDVISSALILRSAPSTSSCFQFLAGSAPQSISRLSIDIS